MKNTDDKTDHGNKYFDITPWENKIRHQETNHYGANHPVTLRVGEFLATAFLQSQREASDIAEEIYDSTHASAPETDSPTH